MYMHVFDSVNKREATMLFLGDVVIFYLSLWLMLFVRNFAIPSRELLNNHLSPFSILFIVWVIVFFIAGLYEKHTVLLKSKLPSIIFNAQVVNSAVAVLFFYLIPYFGITPKTNLFIYLIISFALIALWRIRPYWLTDPKQKQKGILIGSGEEMQELYYEVNNNPRYALVFVSSIDLDEVEELDFQDEIVNRVYSEEITTVVVDTRNEKIEPILPQLYNLIFSRVRFIDMHRVYEDIFDRVPLSLVKYSWFLQNISASKKFTYDFLKRVMDIVLGIILAVASLFVYPFVWLAIFLDDGGPLFFVQERVGKNNRRITLLKFRSMHDDVVTRVGDVLRRTRIDELPQLWNVARGDISLIGPRPELAKLVKVYEREVSYYNVRHLIKPGLSGWAQLYHKNHPHHEADVDETRVKLSYDLYYIKNRSFLLDMKIALKTLKTLLSRSGV
jgi:lipopolysaccharide/colanic/teichoic acid biosynthesis glycosyltransferase